MEKELHLRLGGRCAHVEDPGGSQEVGAGILAPEWLWGGALRSAGVVPLLAPARVSRAWAQL